ncbi:hypothetical protein, partial [Phaeodactylibacter luteus]|uniref:hypothetical protein n=1 Tax=Phaeodactylibacter luteus TaxID=1564516 RepID=UPI0014798399
GNIINGQSQPAIGRVFVADVNEGSWDNCGPVTMTISRDNVCAPNSNSPDGSYVDFFCCDVGVTSDIT